VLNASYAVTLSLLPIFPVALGVDATLDPAASMSEFE
jgi:hypothetical protein